MPHQHREWWPSANQQGAQGGTQQAGGSPLPQDVHAAHGVAHAAHAAPDAQQQLLHQAMPEGDDGFLAELEALLMTGGGEDKTGSSQGSSHTPRPQPQSARTQTARSQPPEPLPAPPALPMPSAAATLEKPGPAEGEPADWAWQSTLLAGVCVVLTDASRELLLSLMPPLHPRVVASSVVIARAPLALRDLVGVLPLGAQVEVGVVGVAASAAAQAVGVSLPGWLLEGGHTLALPLSLATGASSTDADALLADSLAGGGNYHALPEPLPLLGSLSLVLTDATYVASWAELAVRGALTLPCHLLYVLEHAPAPPHAPAHLHQPQPPACAGQGDAVTPVRAVAAPAPVAAPTPTPKPVPAPAPAPAHAERTPAKGAAAPGQPAGTLPQPTPPVPAAGGGEGRGGVGEDDEFELWMQQDERLDGGGALRAALAGAAPEGAGLLGDERARVATVAQRAAGMARVQWLSDVSVGDRARVVPLAGVASPAADGDDAPGVEGVVAEVLADDMYQPRGVLVRLEDDTLGHVQLVVEPGAAAARDAWPDLQLAAAVPTGKKGNGSNKAGKGSTGGGGEGKGSGGGSGAAPGPAGGIRIIHKSGSATRLAPRAKAAHASAASGRGSDAAVDVARRWSELRTAYGDAITGAVLADCGGDVGEAVQVLLDQDALPVLLDEIVARGVERVERQAAEEEARMAAAREQQRDRRAAARDAARDASRVASKRGGGWAARPGSHPLAGKQGAPPPPAEFPGLGGGPLKLLRNEGSLAALAGTAGIPLRAAEALAQLFPSLDATSLVGVLAEVGGDVARAIEALLAEGVAPGGPPPDTTPALPGGSSYAAAAAPARPKGSAPGGDDDLAVLNNVLGLEGKVAYLLDMFTGLDASLAEFTLNSNAGDLPAAAAFLAECLHAHAGVAAAVEAQDAALAAAIAAQDSFATALAAGLPPPGTQPLAAKAAATGKSHGSGRATPATVPATPPRISPVPSAMDLAGAGAAGRASGNAVVDEDGWQRVGGSTPQGEAGGGAEQRGAGPRMAAGAADAADVRTRAKLESGKARHIAQIYYDARNVFYRQAAAAYDAGDRRAAAELAARGRAYGERAKAFRTVANTAAFKGSNLGVANEFTMDLHGMHVEEACEMLGLQLDALSRLVFPGGVLLRVITGKGMHSVGGVPAIKRAVLDLLRATPHRNFVDPSNEGVVVVHVASALQK